MTLAWRFVYLWANEAAEGAKSPQVEQVTIFCLKKKSAFGGDG